VNASSANLAAHSRSDANASDTRLARAPTIFSYAILLGGIIAIVVAIHMMVVSYSSLPYADGWAEIDVVAGGNHQVPLEWFWSQHNEHRLVVPKLFLLADLRLFHARQIFLLTSVLVIQFLHLATLSWSMRVLGGWRGALWRSGTGLAAFCLFCPSQYETLTWGFQTCFVLPGLFATLSFIGLLLYWTDSQRRDGIPGSSRLLWLSILAALVATYSLANGNLLWPLLVATAVFLRLRLAAVLSLAVTGALSTALYFCRYIRPSYHANPVASMDAPATLVKFVTVYFGSSWVRQSMNAAAFIGVAGLVIALAVFLRAKAYARTSRAFTLLLVLTIVFCIGTAFVTAAGRLSFGVQQAFVSRYQTFALLFWCSLGLLWLESAYLTPPGRHRVVLVQACLLAIMLRGAYLAQYPIREARSHGFQLKVASMALFSGVRDWEQFFYHVDVMDPNSVFREAPYMQENRLSIYSGDAYLQLGKPLEQVFQLASTQECMGALQSSSLIQSTQSPALRIIGWAWDVKRGQPPLEIIATTDGTITGLAAVGDWRPKVREANPSVTSGYVGYAGYVRDARKFTSVKLYAVLSGRPQSACYFAAVEPATQQ
jgi:hypothetical protein